jgi:hypothetical protein
MGTLFPLPVADATGAAITTFFRRGYADFIRLNAQQLTSRLEGTVDVETIVGEDFSLDSYGTPTLQERTALRNADNQVDTIDRFRRRFSPRFFEYTEMFDPRDAVRLIRTFRPDGQFARAVMGAFMTMKDCLITIAYDADALDGDGVTPITFLAGHTVAGNFDVPPQTNNALSIAKVIEAKTILEENNVSTTQRWFVALHPRAVAQLLKNLSGESQNLVTNFDFNALRPLMTGQIVQYLGMTWVPTTQIEQTAAMPTSGVPGYFTFVYSQDAIVFGMNGDIEIHFDIIPDKGHSLQVAHYAQLNATRMHELNIARIEGDIV